MIKIRIKNADHEIDVQFPISENGLYAKLAEIHAIEGKEAPQSAFVTEVYWPEEFSMLKGRFANLDELNYLARRMESFDYHEYDQFLIGITKLQNPTEKDLINLTFNLDHFTLCKDVSSYGKIGREYVMNTQGAVPANDEDDPKYATIGKDLIDRGLAQITEKGLLIYNPFDELTEVYDGQTFPEYYYENTLASAEVSYNGRTELLLLPGEELAIQKALARLGAPSDSDCEIKFCLNQGEDDAWEERIEGIIRSEGLYEANKMLRSLDTGDMDWGKLTAAVELTDVKSAANIAAVAEHLGEFAFILAGLGMALNLLPQAGQNLVLAGAIISIMLNPVLFTLLEKYLDKTETLDEQTLEEVLEDEKQVPVDICNHALLVGFGRVGSLLGEKLMAQGIPLVVIEPSRTRVDELRERGIRAVLGNAANEEIMTLAHLDCARWLLLTIPNGYEAGEIVASAREKYPHLEIIARAHYDDEVAYISERGANEVVMGEREIAKTMLGLLSDPPLSEAVSG